MTAQAILFLILVIISLEFIFAQILDYINLNAHKNEIPEEVKDHYDEKKYKKSQQYLKANTKFSFITSTFSLMLAVILLLTGSFGLIDTWLRSFFDNEIILALVYFGLLFISSDILTTPFQIYGTFVIEEKFGFNKTTPKTFILDKIKGYFLSFILGGLIIGLLLFLILTIGKDFWIYFLVAISAFILFINMFYTTLIVPLFNKLTPLEDGELKQAIEEYSKKVRFPLTSIFVIDGSKRSKKGNAFFSGIGKKKKIVLYDTLIENHTTDELVAVLAHEVGHYKKRHIVWSYFLSILQVAVMLYVMSLMIFSEELSLALGATQIGVHLNLLAFGILYSPISKITGLLMNIYSRKNEYEADEYAAKTYSGMALAVALKKLSVDNLSNLVPHPVYVFFNYSHPPLIKRLAAIKANSS